MLATDLPAVLEIQAQCYRGMLLESAAALGSRLALSPATCWVAAGRDGELAAYLFTHMWPQDSLPALDGVLERHWERAGEPASTLSTASGSIPARARTSRPTLIPRSMGETRDKAPPRSTHGVRSAS